MREKIWKILVACILSLLSLQGVFAQYSVLNDYISTEWSTVDGLPANAINDVIQTNDGYIYLGTYEGLVRFNGFEFTLLNKHTGPEYNFISARVLMQDATGNLWVGSNGEGLQKTSPDDTITIYTQEHGLPNNSIRALAEDHIGNVWVGTASGVCYITPQGEIVLPAAAEDVSINTSLVEELFCDSAGRIWMCTTDARGLFYYADNAFQRYQELDYLGTFYATGISQDNFGTFWIGLGTMGMVKVNHEGVEPIVSNTILDNTPLYHICHDTTGATWLGTEGGLVLYREGKWAEHVYHNNSVNKVIQDREGNIWVATDSKGLTKISSGRFSVTNLGIAVNAIAQGQDGLVWVGADNGLLCYQNDTPVKNALTEYCQGLRIRHVEIADNGDVMVSAYSKPAHIRYNVATGHIQNWSTEQKIAGDKTRVSIQLDNGDVYVGTTTGLSLIRPDGSVQTFSKNELFTNEYIMCLYQDDDGVVWIGTDGDGIYLMKDEQIFDKISTENGLAGNVVFKIMQDSTGVYWICTGTGISRYQQNEGVDETTIPWRSFFNYSSVNGLGTDSVFQMIIDHSNTVWMISNRGISSVPLVELNDLATNKNRRTKVDAKFYNQNDGLNSAGANSTALSMRDKNGRIWFTMVDGFAIYDPLKNQASGFLPLVHIESIVLDNVPLNKKSNNFTIPAGARRLDFTYTGLSFVAPERLRFKHMLVGFDTDYSQPTQNRNVSYTNLPPGDYRLLVTAMNAEGVWNSTPTIINFTQEAFFWQHSSFWISCFFILMIFVIFIIYWREQKNKKHQRLLEEMVLLRTEDLRQEQKKSDKLLRNILPDSVADKLKQLNSDNVADSMAEYFDEATILFADIVGFTQISDREGPAKMVSALNKLFSRFDQRALSMGVEKIKTIGDCYMAACGIPTPNANHVTTMIEFARGIQKDLEEYNKESPIQFSMRIGLNSGPVVAGVIGTHKFIYDVWGDTVNVACRMEPLCTQGKIRLTQMVKDKMNEQDLSQIIAEYDVDVRGKGMMKTYEL